MTALPPLTPETPADSAEAWSLIDAAFGPGRYAKTAERLREGNSPLLDISCVARDSGRVVGCAQMWPIKVGGRDAILLGPFAVADAWRSRGLGSALIEKACALAADAGHDLVLLVGDAAYFEKLAFVPAPDCRLPGPVNQDRVLVRALKAGAAEGLGGAVTR